mgnify:CR=1 FL=1
MTFIIGIRSEKGNRNMDTSLLVEGGVAGVVASLLFSLVKSYRSDWDGESKWFWSWAIAAVAGVVATVIDGKVAVTDFGVVLPMALASSQVWYKKVSGLFHQDAVVGVLKASVAEVAHKAVNGKA